MLFGDFFVPLQLMKRASYIFLIVLMRYHLLRADAQNKCFVPFTTDSVMKEVAHYYE